MPPAFLEDSCSQSSISAKLPFDDGEYCNVDRERSKPFLAIRMSVSSLSPIISTRDLSTFGNLNKKGNGLLAVSSEGRL